MTIYLLKMLPEISVACECKVTDGLPGVVARRWCGHAYLHCFRRVLFCF